MNEAAAAMNEAELVRKHELWLNQGDQRFQMQLSNLRTTEHAWFDLQGLMQSAQEPHRLESVQRAINNLPREGMTPRLHLIFCFRPSDSDRDSPNPPSQEAVEETAMELARIMESSGLLKMLHLRYASASFVESILTVCPGLESIRLESCTSPLVASCVRSIFSTESIATLRTLRFDSSTFPDSESIEEFRRGIENSKLVSLVMQYVSIARASQELEGQLASTLARCNTMVHFEFQGGATALFSERYCPELSNNVDTKLERLRLRYTMIDLNGEEGTVNGLDAAMESKIRNRLKWNVQRTTCPPLFAAIDNAETGAERKQRMVEAFEAVDVPILFENVLANKSNLIALIQRLGRDRKRKRED